MCDCYVHTCQMCDNGLSIHIADFCTRRSNIFVFCPDCLEWPKGGLVVSSYSRLFICRIEFRKQLSGKLRDGRYKGKIVLIFCKDAEAYGIDLN